jgi:hypothetical protein
MEKPGLVISASVGSWPDCEIFANAVSVRRRGLLLTALFNRGRSDFHSWSPT